MIKLKSLIQEVITDSTHQSLGNADSDLPKKINWPEGPFTIKDLVSKNSHMLTSSGSDIKLRVELSKAIKKKDVIIQGQKPSTTGRPQLIFITKKAAMTEPFRKAFDDTFGEQIKEDTNDINLLNTLVELLKTPNKPGVFNEIRQLTKKLNMDSLEMVYKYLFDKVGDYAKGKEEIIIHELTESMYQAKLVTPKARDVPFLACMYKILKHLH
jgi:hypothetical protein